MLSIHYSINGLFTFKSNEIKDTEPFIYLIGVNENGGEPCNIVKDSFYQIGEPDCSGYPVVTLLICECSILHVFALVNIGSYNYHR